MVEKGYAYLYGSGTSSLLCLTKPWSGSDRAVVAGEDSGGVFEV